MYAVTISLKSPTEHFDTLSDFFKGYYLLQQQKADEEVLQALLSPGSEYVIDNFVFDKFGALFFHAINEGWISAIKYQEFNIDNQEFKLRLYSNTQQEATSFLNYLRSLSFWQEWKDYLNRNQWIIGVSVDQTDIMQSSQELSEEWLRRPISHQVRFRFLC